MLNVLVTETLFFAQFLGRRGLLLQDATPAALRAAAQLGDNRHRPGLRELCLSQLGI
jgi:hypothetical protein